ncbi:tRNA uridine-5-carboxymethylaminomethyl(34) synthesis GTPase MnmE [Rhizobium deserti]|uniref:tRNA modification GTPase MnmE n=1 Tax=Rhizobium deserti TaxID=2547961 RepID=A0A4V3ANB2_9HYPH|nr:tRNA uridine-5-carboxymethylaminomethyl(34) synthesis GTPase MnmE [Rhizobium deserti]TDK30374.1 tRNA uridine-5-carboxymethylaminomethyl(34) synthesis GTPase MnmE [Rhizobium deserti]
MPNTSDSIFALSSGTLPAGVAVVRMSGPKSFQALAALTADVPPPRQAMLRALRGQTGDVIDHGLVVTFPAPHSFTGEDCVELHLHGSRAVFARISQELSLLGLRLAEAGEFSRRAFENGKIDLVEVEGLADLISAETEMQRKLAVEQGFGGQSQLYMDWARRLTHARALIEAELDFVDEDDIPGSVSDRVWADVAALSAEMTRHIAAAKTGEIIRDGYKVVIAGPPNAGKSSLLNALAQRDVAIVTDIAGTTRDVLHVDLDLNGFLVRVFDTAGIRDTDDIVEREGVRRAITAIDQADLVIQLQEIDSPPQQDKLQGLPEVLNVGTKVDICGQAQRFDLCISVVTGEGLDQLRGEITARLKQHWTGFSVPSRERHISHLREATEFIKEALAGHHLDLRSESLRAAASALGRITGRVDVEQLLDVIFSQFCVGK